MLLSLLMLMLLLPWSPSSAAGTADNPPPPLCAPMVAVNEFVLLTLLLFKKKLRLKSGLLPFGSTELLLPLCPVIIQGLLLPWTMAFATDDIIGLFSYRIVVERDDF